MSAPIRWGLGLGAALVLFASPAAAFERAASFSNPVIDPNEELNGGGDERWFTGSPLDGLTCGVCHQGDVEDPDTCRPDGQAPIDTDQVELRGLPPGGWVPGQAYELELELPEPASNVRSGAVEITDRNGAAVGTLSAGPELCPPRDMDMPDVRDPRVEIIDVPGSRRQIAMGNQCDSERLTVTWTTPAEPVTAVLLSAVAVGAGTPVSLGSPDCDAAVVIQRQLAVAGDIGEGPRVGTVCSVHPGQANSAPLAALLLVALLLARRRR